MENYDPLLTPDPAEWQALDDDERLTLVMEYHQNTGVELPNEMLHATIHVIVEKQMVLGLEPVLEAMKRLLHQGLDRHEAVHAIGSVLTGHMHKILSNQNFDPGDHQQYYERLKKLTAEKWLNDEW